MFCVTRPRLTQNFGIKPAPPRTFSEEPHRRDTPNFAHSQNRFERFGKGDKHSPSSPQAFVPHNTPPLPHPLMAAQTQMARLDIDMRHAEDAGL